MREECQRVTEFAPFPSVEEKNKKGLNVNFPLPQRGHSGRAGQMWQPQSNSEASNTKSNLLHNWMFFASLIKPPIFAFSWQMKWMHQICGWVYQDKQFKYDKGVEAN